jgi:hypothetical protein
MKKIQPLELSIRSTPWDIYHGIMTKAKNEQRISTKLLNAMATSEFVTICQAEASKPGERTVSATNQREQPMKVSPESPMKMGR